MNKRQLSEIKNSIRIREIKLLDLKPRLDEKKPALNAAYNRILIEKAVLREKLTRKEPSLAAKIMKKICGRKKELICDYFK